MMGGQVTMVVILQGHLAQSPLLGEVTEKKLYISVKNGQYLTPQMREKQFTDAKYNYLTFRLWE